MIMNLHVQGTGPSGAPTIVFLHGGGGAGWMWQPQVEQLTDYHCLVPDLPEQGQSIGVKPFTMPGAASQVAELIRTRAHGGKAHLVGLSLGAQLTTLLLSTVPELVDHAIISSALLRPIAGSWLMRPWLLKATFWSTVTPFKRSDSYTRLNMRMAGGVPDRYFPQFRSDFRAMTAQGFADFMVAGMNFRLPPGLERVTTPVLVVVAQKEYKAMKQSASDLVTAIPKAQGYVVDLPRNWIVAQQHNWNMNAPKLFTRMVRAWITDQALPTELKPL